jgi:undecaprenyl-diphosphatase
MNRHATEARRRPELAIAATLATIALLAFVVLKLGSEIAEGETNAFDRAALIWVRSHLGGSSGLRSFMLDLTALGDTTVLAIIIVLVTGYLAIMRRLRLAGLLVVQTAVGTSLASLLKPWFGRLRPDVVPHWVDVASASFPSGHAANSAVVYLSLAALAARATPSPPARAYLMSTAAMLACGIGLSRVYLGVHWPTDILAGWALGGGWVILCAMLTRSLRAI